MSKSIFTALAFIVSFAAASAAELPGRQDQTPDKAKKCDIGGVAGMMLPGTDTCVKISGGIGVEAIGASRKPIHAANGQ